MSEKASRVARAKNAGKIRAKVKAGKKITAAEERDLKDWDSEKKPGLGRPASSGKAAKESTSGEESKVAPETTSSEPNTSAGPTREGFPPPPPPPKVEFGSEKTKAKKGGGWREKYESAVGREALCVSAAMPVTQLLVTMVRQTKELAPEMPCVIDEAFLMDRTFKSLVCLFDDKLPEVNIKPEFEVGIVGGVVVVQRFVAANIARKRAAAPAETTAEWNNVDTSPVPPATTEGEPAESTAVVKFRHV